MIIHLHCFSWHDSDRLAHVLKLYAGWVDHFHFWLLHSHVGEPGAALTGLPNVTLHRYKAESDSIVDTQRIRFDEAWKLSSGQADWVVMLHADEELYHPDPLAYLRQAGQDGVTAVRAIGYDMVGDQAPVLFDQDRPLSEQVTQGCRSPALDRLVMFSPAALTATNFSPGLHHAWPEGHVVWPANPELLLLRFEMLGPAHFVSICNQRAADLLPEDRAQRWAAHLDWLDGELLAHMDALRARARTVPGLGELAGIPPQDYRHAERTLEQSGLFDADWYEAEYPDISAQQFDALTHYCEYGWREGRRPNACFDPAWYARQCGPELRPDENPLLHYIEIGERAGWSPSPDFDPTAYRALHGLVEHASALHHFLEHRQSGETPPLPAVETPLPNQTELQPAPTALAALSRPVPRWEPLLNWVESQQGGALGEAGVPLAAVQDLIREFLPWLPFDEQWYLEANPDVADAVEEGVFASAQAHFIEHGFFEGRLPVAPENA